MNFHDKLGVLCLANELRNIANSTNIITDAIHPNMVLHINSNIENIINKLKNKYPIFSRHLQIVSPNLFFKQNNADLINPFVCGQVLELLDILCEIYDLKVTSVWHYIHPKIIETSQKLYLDGHYVEAAYRAILEINDRMKEIYKKLNPEDKNIPDGVELMEKMLAKGKSENSKAMFQLNENISKTDLSEQRGFQFMFSGAWTALRNPMAHSNDEVIDANESMRRLMFASMLMYKIDEGVKLQSL